MSLKGLNSTLLAFDKLEAEITKKVKQEVFNTAEDIEYDAIMAVPVDLGDLRQSISKRPENGGWNFKVIVDKDYGAYVEFGTGDNVDVPEGLEEYAMQWFVNGKGKLHARPYIFPAYDKARINFIGELKKILGA